MPVCCSHTQDSGTQNTHRDTHTKF